MLFNEVLNNGSPNYGGPIVNLGEISYEGQQLRLKSRLQEVDCISNPYLTKVVMEIMEDLLEMDQIGEPLSFPRMECGDNLLKEEEYKMRFLRESGPMPQEIKTEASQENVIAIMNHVNLVEILMDVLKGHGMSSSYLEELRSLHKEFFSLPMEEKQKCCRASDGIEGYGPDPILVEGQVLDWCDRIFLTVHPQEYRDLRRWPQNPTNFREKLAEYGMKVKVLTETLLKIMSKLQNMEEDRLVEEMGEKTLIHARFNYYPKCPKPNEILGLKAHADASAITYILQDEIISNGVFKSPLHRAGANSERERRSIAVSYSPNYEKEIEPIEGFIDSERPRIFRRVKNYYNINVESYFAGKIAIETVKVSPNSE
ncbi:hypothetical protein HAX54_015195 [Datura stramonium]|uniref:Uncharacterized protein n=1 Tax=Datura stramonium TaxID=4076 RepID=A0ABS8TR08_DATST|nr:hypothetical protein [Datura stramonium]